MGEMDWKWIVKLVLFLPAIVTAKGLCEVETNQSNLILDIQESKGTSINQETVPRELAVSGDPWNEISLELIFTKGAPSFVLNGKKLQLLKPLDRDQDNISHVVFQLQCTVRATGKKKTIPVIVRVTDINDNAPMFLATPYQTSISEATPVGTTIFQGLKAVDGDAGVNGLVEYRIIEGEPPSDPVSRLLTADGSSHFAIHLPHQGQVTVVRALDFERTQRYLVTVVATDRARNVSERFSATTTLTVNIRDADDQEPSFIYQGCTLLHGSCINPEYSSTVSSGVLSGVLAISPEKIQAIDMDSLNSPIAYSFLSGNPPSYAQYFEINPSTGIVKQIKPVDSSSIKNLEIIIKAEEVSEAKRYATAKLFVTVKPVDASPPQISASASEGWVDENAPVGTKVLDKNSGTISFSVSDSDIGPDDVKPAYTYELTSSFFNIDNEGLLVVGSDQLDRDPPSPGIFRFQVVAREKHGTAASAPLTMMVTLNDVNDNAPRLPMIPPLSVQAGENHRQIAQVTATDNDVGINAEISYSIYHVSNNGRNKFKIDPTSGDIEAIGKLTAGEQYSITVQATDAGGKSSQTIVEVTVVPGPNTQRPLFPQSIYEVSVSEGAPINSTVATITAVDPENEPVTYSIVSGNDLRQFGINDRLGIISVIRRLDREDLTRYQLVIKAEDEGGLYSTATVNVRVSDINDKNPEFSQPGYSLSVKEGLVGAHLGRVIATDADEGANAAVTYSLPSDVPFTIDQATGDIFTNTALDYEQHKEYKFIVTAQDGAPEPRLATATVTVEVIDTEDELPIFHQPNYEAKVVENMPDYVITQVKADDPDTMKRVTYILKQGPTEYFSVDPKSGKVKTIKRLDYETESQHTLIIGTEENNSTRPGATTKVIIHVEDRNDIPPVFMMVPRPITLDDNVPIGTKVTTLIATDSDGTPPGNKVRYEIVGRGKSSKYFHIDPDLGTITVRDDLSKETEAEYQIDVKASDLGQPQLSSVTSVAVFVRRTATVPPDPNLGFPEDSYTIHVPEDTPSGSLLRKFEVLSTRTPHQIPLRCSLIQSNYSSIFVVKTTGGRECELRLGDKELDYEKKSSYSIQLQIDSLAGLINPAKNQTSVKIEVDDVNDNGPYFVYPEYAKLFKKDKYFGGIPNDTKEIGTLVLQVQAKDADSGRAGMIEYSIINSTKWAGYFTIDPLGGFIRASKSLNDDGGDRPIVLHVQARDGPTNGTNHVATTQVIINEVSDEDRVILQISGMDPDKAKELESKIATAIEEATGLITGVEKVVINPPSNVTLVGMGVYFIDPTTETILSRSTEKIKNDVLSNEGIHNMTLALHKVINDARVDTAEGPPAQPVDPIRTAVLALQWDAFPLAVILIAILILLLGGAGIVYICVSWSRYKAYKERMQRMYVMPRYDPVFVEPNLKEYETQVLQMSVPMDDNDSYHDLQIDFSNKNHAFSLDNVSYITKDHRNGGSPASSEAATTARASSIGRHNNNNSIQGNINHSYHRSDEDLGPGSASPTNENVTFREKKDYSHLGFNYLMDRSIETTTEL